jgi:RNA-directed DNA polymerase
MKELRQYLNGWVAHFRLCTAEAIKGLRAIDAHIRRRLRAIIIRQRKRPRFLFRHLRSRGSGSHVGGGRSRRADSHKFQPIHV